MKLIILSSEFPPGPGGIGDHAYNLAEQLVKNRIEVTVITELREEFTTQWKDTKPLAHVIYRRRGRILANFNLLLAFIRHFLKYPDALWIATGTRSLMILGTAMVFFRRKSIAILHGHELLPAHWLKTWLTRNTITKFTSAICVSEFSRENAKQFVREEKLEVIPNGFNPDKFRGASRERRANNPGQIALLTVGRISTRKGQHNMINALPQVLKKFPGANYHLVGMSGDSSALVDLMKKLDLQNRVIIHGVLTDQELTTLFNAIDIFVMLSENVAGGDVEGFGIAIIEANYFGIPAVGALGCGVEQAIRDGFNGKLVDPHDTTAISNAIEHIVSNYPAYSANAIAWSQEHVWGLIIQKYLTVIKKIAEPTQAFSFFRQPQNYLRKDFNVLVRRALVKDFAGELHDKSILDMGCGDGRISLQFSSTNQLMLVDASDKMLTLAREYTPHAAQGNVKYILSSLEAAPLQKEGYDLIIAMGILAHLDSWTEGLKILASSLKKGGRIMIQISDSSNWFVRQQLKPAGNRRHSLNHIEFDSLERTCAQLGLVKTNVKRYGFTVRGMGRMPNKFLYHFTMLTARTRLFNRLSTEVIGVFEKV